MTLSCKKKKKVKKVEGWKTLKKLFSRLGVAWLSQLAFCRKTNYQIFPWEQIPYGTIAFTKYIPTHTHTHTKTRNLSSSQPPPAKDGSPGHLYLFHTFPTSHSPAVHTFPKHPQQSICCFFSICNIKEHCMDLTAVLLTQTWTVSGNSMNTETLSAQLLGSVRTIIRLC